MAATFVVLMALAVPVGGVIATLAAAAVMDTMRAARLAGYMRGMPVIILVPFGVRFAFAFGAVAFTGVANGEVPMSLNRFGFAFSLEYSELMSRNMVTMSLDWSMVALNALMRCWEFRMVLGPASSFAKCGSDCRCCSTSARLSAINADGAGSSTILFF